jgi:hypothetical protein
MNIRVLKNLLKAEAVQFQYYRDQKLWYTVVDSDHPFKEFLFPVPIEDIGNATFKRNDKPILFMRYIRKQLETLDEARKGHE